MKYELPSRKYLYLQFYFAYIWWDALCKKFDENMLISMEMACVCTTQQHHSLEEIVWKLIYYT